MPRLRFPVTPLLFTVTGTWLIVAIYAMLHDQYIVAFAPEHFTRGHPPVPGVDAPWLQALALAFGASIAPGFAFGVGLGMASQEGPWPKVDAGTALGRAGAAVLATEVTALAVGAVAWTTGWKVYGPGWYPAWGGVEIVTAQTIQLTAYLAGAGFAGLAIAGTLADRYSRRSGTDTAHALNP